MSVEFKTSLFDKVFKRFFKDPKKLNLIFICIIVSETIGGFLYIKGLQERAKPVGDIIGSIEKVHTREVSAIQAEHSLEIKTYKYRIDSLETVIDKNETELSRLSRKLAVLQEQRGNEDEVALLIEEIDLKEHQIDYYQKQIAYLEKQLKQKQQLEITNESVEGPPKEELIINVPPDDVKGDQTINIKELNLSKKIPHEGKIEEIRTVVSQGTTAYDLSDLHRMLKAAQDQKEKAVLLPITSVVEDTVYLFTGFRSKPKALSDIEAKLMVLEYNFVDYRCNPYGHGFANQFERKEIQDDKVIIDQAASLMWMTGGSVEMMSFNDAKRWIKALNQQGYAGYHDWRLPTLEEALSILERRKNKNGVLYINSFFSDIQKFIWTSDLVKNQSKAWFIFLHNGSYYKSKLSSKYYVKAVRTINSDELMVKK